MGIKVSSAAQKTITMHLPKRSVRTRQHDILMEALGPLELLAALPYTPQIVKALREAIVELRLAPGTPLSEAALADMLHVSRTPVREALRELANENLIDIFPQAGTLVSPIRLSLVEQGVFVRHALETANILDLAKSMTPDMKQRIEAFLEKQEVAIRADDQPGFFLLDEGLHQLFFELTDRLPIWNIVNQSKQHVNRVRHLLMREMQENTQRAYQEHLEIVQALFSNDVDRLAGAMHMHIGMLKENALEYVAQTHSNYFTD